MNERDVEISKREAKKKERRSRKDKLAIEKRILRLSLWEVSSSYLRRA